MTENSLDWELNHARKLLNFLMSPSNAAVNSAFIDAVDVKLLGLHDYHDVIKEPMWLNKMLQKLDDCIYQSISDFVCDFRLMLLNCYRYNGVDSFIGKIAHKFEIIFEQRLQTLPHDLRNKTTMQAIMGGCDTVTENAEAAGLVRRRSAAQTNRLLNKASSATPMFALAEEIELQANSSAVGEVEDYMRERCSQMVDQLRSWEQKRLDVRLLDSWETWWDDQCSGDNQLILRHSFELLQVYQFLCISDPVLGVSQLIQAPVKKILGSRALSLDEYDKQLEKCGSQLLLNPYCVHLNELEMSLLAAPEASSLLAAIFHSLLSSPKERLAWTKPSAVVEYKTEGSSTRGKGGENSPNALPTYESWHAELKRRVSYWYSLWRDRCKEDLNLVALKLKIDPLFFEVLGFDNPMESKEFHQLSFYQRIAILKALVEHVNHNQESFHQTLDKVIDWEEYDSRPAILGIFDGKVYIRFPCFVGDSSLRIYRYPECEWPDMLDAVGSVESEEFYDKCASIPMGDPMRMPFWYSQLIDEVTASVNKKGRGRARQSQKLLAELFDINKMNVELGVVDADGRILKRKTYKKTIKKQRSRKSVTKAQPSNSVSGANSIIDDSNPPQSVSSKFCESSDDDDNNEEPSSNIRRPEVDDSVSNMAVGDETQDSYSFCQNATIKVETEDKMEVDAPQHKPTELSMESSNDIKDPPSVKLENGVDNSQDVPTEALDKFQQDRKEETTEVLHTNGISHSHSQNNGTTNGDKNAEKSDDKEVKADSSCVEPAARLPTKSLPCPQFECVAMDTAGIRLLLAELRAHLTEEVDNLPKTRGKAKGRKVNVKMRELRALIGNIGEILAISEEHDPLRLDCLKLLRLKIRREIENLKEMKEKQARSERAAKAAKVVTAAAAAAVSTTTTTSEIVSRPMHTVSYYEDDSDDSDDEEEDSYSSSGTPQFSTSSLTREERLKRRQEAKVVHTRQRPSLPVTITRHQPGTEALIKPRFTAIASKASLPAGYSSANGQKLLAPRTSFPDGNRDHHRPTPTPAANTLPPSGKPKLFKIQGRHYLETGHPVEINSNGDGYRLLDPKEIPDDALEFARRQIQLHVARLAVASSLQQSTS